MAGRKGRTREQPAPFTQQQAPPPGETVKAGYRDWQALHEAGLNPAACILVAESYTGSFLRRAFPENPVQFVVAGRDGEYVSITLELHKA